MSGTSNENLVRLVRLLGMPEAADRLFGFLIGGENPFIGGRISEVMDIVASEKGMGLACLTLLTELGLIVREGGASAKACEKTLFRAVRERLPISFGQVRALVENLPVFNDSIRAGADCYELVATIPEELSVKGPPVSLGRLHWSLLAMVREANQSIILLNPFFDEKGFEFLGREIDLAIGRGVRVSVLTREQNVQLFRKIYASASRMPTIKLVPKSKRYGETIHAKAMVVDSKKAYIGSGNILMKSLEESLEIGVVLEGKKVLRLAQLMEWILCISQSA